MVSDFRNNLYIHIIYTYIYMWICKLARRPQTDRFVCGVICFRSLCVVWCVVANACHVGIVTLCLCKQEVSTRDAHGICRQMTAPTMVPIILQLCNCLMQYFQFLECNEIYVKMLNNTITSPWNYVQVMGMNLSCAAPFSFWFNIVVFVGICRDS